MAKYKDWTRGDEQCFTSDVGFGPRGDYYHYVMVKDGKIVGFGEEQGNYAGGIYASPTFNTECFKHEKERLKTQYPELYEKIKDIPLAKTYKPADKAIYQPKGKAGEYAAWACNFYTGCSNDCQYCYCKRGVLSHVWSTTPQLKKCFKDTDDAIATFRKELDYYIANSSIQSRGLFFSFTTDPLLDETGGLTVEAAEYAIRKRVPVQILTKRADGALRFVECLSQMLGGIRPVHKIAIGFTLTGFDELETNASLTESRIHAMRTIHALGLRTFASLEPMLDLTMTEDIINCTLSFCDLYKIGLLSGGKQPIDPKNLFSFIPNITYKIGNAGAKVYWKKSISDLLDGAVYSHPAAVDDDYDIFSINRQWPHNSKQPFNPFML